MGRLIVIVVRTSEPEIEIGPEGGGVLLGRGPEAHLRLYDETASREHARLRQDGGRTVLEDLESANGLLLNGETVEGSAVLFHGDEIQIGSVRLRFLTDSGADRETVAAPLDPDRVEAAVDPDDADPAEDLGGGAATRRLRLVCDGATACTDAGDETEIPGILLSLVREAFAPARATVALRAAGEDCEEVVAAHPEKASLPASTTLRRRVLAEGEAVLIADAMDTELRATALSLAGSRYRSTLAAPLRTTEGVLGMVVVEAAEPDRYGKEDLRALAAAARQAALALRNLRALSSARAEVGRLATGEAATDAPRLLGRSQAILDVRETIAKAAPVDSNVLITGETGTGKELVARLLHVGGVRRRRPFVALNCAAIVEGLLESELFGHERGAFTGATQRQDGRIVQARKGTFFLDEVGDLPAALQAKLLRVLSEGTFTRVGGHKTLRVACRIVAATNRDLRAMVEEGSFRQDLYYRFAVVEIHLPPLRERPQDVELLAEAALGQLAARLGRRIPRLSADAREVLVRHPWPGNVRELFNALERALVLHEGDTITAEDLPADVRRPAEAPAEEEEAPEVLTIREAERRAVVAALQATNGKKGRAAELLGISWPTLNRKIREYGLD